MKSFILKNETIRRTAHEFIDTLTIDGKFVVAVKKVDRTLDQNKAQWPILNAFATQLEWPVNGKMCKMSAEDWKDVLTSAFKKENARIAFGLDGGMVFLGQRTSKFNKEEFDEWLEFLKYVAADRGVKIPVGKSESVRYNEFY